MASFYRNVGKRAFDFATSSTAFVLLLPVLLVLGALISARQGRPVLYQQVRPGRNGKPFNMYKFRTMTEERGEDGLLLSDAERLTSFGRFLRRTSLDELPELWNVIKGDMSLVGPRPLLMDYLPKYTEEQARRHDVRPGITGWAQIKGRQTIKFSERLVLDVWYVDNVSFRLDLYIIWRTVLQAFQGRDVVLGQEVAEVDDLGLSENTDTSRSFDGEKQN